MPRTFSIAPFVRALRPHQWLKNLLVFLPMALAHQFTPETFLSSLAAFALFSLAASGVYVFNDLADLSADRAHPRKCARPFASGALTVAQGAWLAAALLLSSVLLASFLGWPFVAVLFIYALAAIAYSLALKRRLIIDICVLAGLHTLRIVAGGAATGIALSVWLLAFSIFFFFALAAVKRQAELVDWASTGDARINNGRGYAVTDVALVANMALASGYLSVLVMALYIESENVRALYQAPSFLWGICPILLYWISRMVIITHRGEMPDDPLIFAVRDPASLVCLFAIGALGVAGALL